MKTAVEEALFQCWQNGNGITQARATIKRKTGVDLDREFIRTMFAKWGQS